MYPTRSSPAIPYGYRLDERGLMRRNEAEQRVIAEILHLRGLPGRRGTNMSAAAIARELNARGIRNRRGAAWTRHLVAKVVLGNAYRSGEMSALRAALMAATDLPAAPGE